MVLWPLPALGQAEPKLIRVEEDWQLRLDIPDANSDAPQITCSISPIAGIEGLHASLDLNQQTAPSYSPGGLQLHVWDGDVRLADSGSSRRDMLSTPDETIQWTMRMELGEATLGFQVVNGHSTTWGDFGGPGELGLTTATTWDNLNHYSPEVSVRNSAASFASNRVKSLVLLRVRYFLSTGEQLEDTTPRVVCSQN